MSKIHFLSFNGLDCNVVVHFVCPNEENSIGKFLKSCYTQDKSNLSSILKIGVEPSNISINESDSIKAGDIIEISTKIPIESGGTTLASVNEMVEKIISNEIEKIRQKYKYFGKIQD